MKKLFFISLILFSILARAQQKQGQALIDSLLMELPTASKDTNKAKILDLLAFTYSSIDPDEGLKYAKRAKELSQEIGWGKGVAKAYAEMGINYGAKSDHPKALYYNKKSLKLFNALNDMPSTAAILANMSIIYRAQSNYPKALKYAFQALEIQEDLNNKISTAAMLGNVGTIYLDQKNYEETRKYYSRSLKIYEELNHQIGMARTLGNFGIIEDANGNYDKALDYHFLALKTNEKIGNKGNIQINLANIGYVYSHMHKFSEALEYQFEALRITQDLGMKGGEAINLGNIGETYFAIITDTAETTGTHPLIPKGRIANMELAIKYLERAIDLCEEINYVGPQIEFSKYLSEAYSLSGEYKKAFNMFNHYTAIRDSVFSQQSKVELANLETQRELDLKDKDIIIHNKQLEISKLIAKNKRNERIIYISGIVLLLLIIGLIVRRIIRRNREHKDLLADIARVQAHEVRAPIASILGLAQLFNHENPSDSFNKEIITHITSETHKLDEVVKKVVNKTR